VTVLGAWAASAQPSRQQTVIDVLEVHGVISPPVAAAIQDTVELAVAGGSSAVLLDIDSPGVLSVNLSLITPVLEANIPVIVWIGQDAVARGGAAYLVAAADVVVVAPTATVGPAIPFELADGEPGSADPARDGLSDYTSLRRTVVAEREDPRILASELAVDEFDAPTLIRRGIADLTAETRDLALAGLSGAVVRKGTSVFALNVDPETTTLLGHELSVSRRLLATASIPVVAFVLLILAVAALLALPVRAAAATLVLGVVVPFLLFGLAAVPARWWAVTLVVIGLTFVAFDAGLVWLGAPTVLGLACVALGGLNLTGGAASLAIPPAAVGVVGVVGTGVSLWGRHWQDGLIARLLAEEDAALAAGPLGPAPAEARG